MPAHEILELDSPVLCTLTNPSAVARVRSAFPDASVRRVGIMQLGVSPSVSGSISMLVAGAEILDDASARTVMRLRRAYPGMAVLAYLPPDPRLLPQIFHIQRDLIDGLLVETIDDHVENFRSFLRATKTSLYLDSVACRLQELLPGLTREQHHLVAVRIRSLKDPNHLSEALGVPLRKLREILRADGIATPRRYLAWCRMLVAARLLEAGSCTAETVSGMVDYSSSTSYHNACRHFVHARPSEIRAGGGVSFVAKRFAKTIRAAAG